MFWAVNLFILIAQGTPLRQPQFIQLGFFCFSARVFSNPALYSIAKSVANASFLFNAASATRWPRPQCSSTSATPRAHRDARLLSRVFSIVKFQLNAVRDARISFPSYRYIAVLCCRIGPLLRAPAFHRRSMETVAPSWGKNYSSFSTKLRLQINLCGPD